MAISSIALDLWGIDCRKMDQVGTDAADSPYNRGVAKYVSISR